MVGKLYSGLTHYGNEKKDIVKVESTYDKRDIDPECVESIAIVSMVKVTILSGPNIGKTVAYRRAVFNSRFEALT